MSVARKFNEDFVECIHSISGTGEVVITYSIFTDDFGVLENIPLERMKVISQMLNKLIEPKLQSNEKAEIK